MIPTFRLLLLLLLGSLLVAGIAWQPLMFWLAIGYVVLLGIAVAVDYAITTKAGEVEAERLNDSKLSLGAENVITVLLANRSVRPLHFQLRDEYPYQFNSDAVILSGVVEPFNIYEARYHVKPLQRSDYTFGDINLRYISTMKLFVRQVRIAAQAQVKVYPNVLDVRKYDLLARKGLLFEIGLRASRQFGLGSEFERLREYNTDDEYRRINWKATARRGKPIAAEFETERSQHVICVLDTGRLMAPPVGDHTRPDSPGLARLDYVINTALMLSYVATLRGDHVGMLAFADEVGAYLGPRRGRGQFQRLLEALYNVQAQPVEADYAAALGFLSLKQKRRALALIFTDLVTLEAARPLIAHAARLARRHLPVVVTISDPNVAGLAGRPAPDSQALYRRAVAEQLLDERQVILDTLQRSGVLTIDVPADKLTVAVVNTYMRLKAQGRL